MNYLEITGTALGFVYLYLEYKASAWLWIASIAMPAIYLAVYYEAGLYADFGISIYYMLASIYGLAYWLCHGRRNNSAPLRISHTPKKFYLPLTVVFLAIFSVLGYVLSRFTDSNVPWSDSFTTALSIVAMWMLARKYLEQWIVWIAADIGCAILYLYKGLSFTAVLYAIYAVVAVLGYLKWKRLMNNGFN